MEDITPEMLSPVLAFMVGVVVFFLFFRFIVWNTPMGRLMRKSVVFFVFVSWWTYCGATKPGDGERLLNSSRRLMSVVSSRVFSLPKSETLSSPAFPDQESSASVGFRRERGCEIMDVFVTAQCVNTEENSLEIVFAAGEDDKAHIDAMVGFEDGAWIRASGDACAIGEVGICPPVGRFELTMSLTLALDGRVSVCEVRAGGMRVPFLEEAVRASSPRDWRRLTVYSRNEDGPQPSIEVGSGRVGMVIKIK